LNFLPLPIVDGGLMVFLIIEKIKGSPVGIRTQVVTQLVGIALFATMFVLITFKDIADLIG
ncbi:MAG: site-2 protease family protein, partial [Planctomycetes bacterium]|nr:site-2 protease family protein [Planctomycetota bacterium]